MKRLMVDIETWSLRPNAAIRSIGAVLIVGDEISSNAYYQNVSDGDYPNEDGFHREPSTVEWWQQQSIAAQSIFSENQCGIARALSEFSDYYKQHKPSEVWANGAQFDIVVLETAFKLCGFKVPWEYSEVRDFRTLRKLFGERYEFSRLTDTIAHRADHDALEQARELLVILEAVGIRA
jgi:DNA polymerase III epsilon subunit-like protein